MKYFYHSIQFLTHLFCSLNRRTMKCFSSLLSSSVFLPVREEQRYYLKKKFKCCSGNSLKIFSLKKFSLKIFLWKLSHDPCLQLYSLKSHCLLDTDWSLLFLLIYKAFCSLYFIQTCLLSPLIFALSPTFFTSFVILYDIKDLPPKII